MSFSDSPIKPVKNNRQPAEKRVVFLPDLPREEAVLNGKNVDIPQ